MVTFKQFVEALQLELEQNPSMADQTMGFPGMTNDHDNEPYFKIVLECAYDEPVLELVGMPDPNRYTEQVQEKELYRCQHCGLIGGH